MDYSTDSIKLHQDDLVKMMEVQANSFASYLLMPQTKLINEVNRIFKLMNIRTGRFYLDNQMCNIKKWKLLYVVYRTLLMSLKRR